MGKTNSDLLTSLENINNYSYFIKSPKYLYGDQCCPFFEELHTVLMEHRQIQFYKLIQ